MAIPHAKPHAAAHGQPHGGGVGFLLTDLPGLVIGFQADMTGLDLTLNGANVIKLGHAELTQFEQTLDAKRFVLGIGGDGLPEITSTGIDEFMVSPAISLTLDFTVVILFKSPSLTEIVYEQSISTSSNDGFSLFTTTNHNLTLSRGANTSRRLFNASLTSYLVLTDQCDGTHTGHRQFVNEVEVGSDSITDDPGLGATSDNIYIGARAGTGVFSEASYRAFGVYSPRLSDADRATLFAGLTGKFPL